METFLIKMSNQMFVTELKTNREAPHPHTCCAYIQKVLIASEEHSQRSQFEVRDSACLCLIHFSAIVVSASL